MLYRACMSVLPLILALAAGPDALSALEAKAAAAKGLDGPRALQSRSDLRKGVLKLIGRDGLRTGSDFRRAAVVWTVENNDFEDARVRYELVLTAVALDDKEGRDQLVPAWDALQLSMGRPQRFGTVLEAPDTPRRPFEAVAQVVSEAYKGQPATSESDDAEVRAIVDADQAARQGDFSKLTVKQIEEMVEGDRKRLARIKVIVAGPTLQTPTDFFNAALTMQHGSEVRDIVMAHELAVASVLRGDRRSGRWLAAASYDRMLRYGGHRQRFATQYDMQGLQKVDTLGINDTMRKALHCPTLDAAKKRVFK